MRCADYTVQHDRMAKRAVADGKRLNTFRSAALATEQGVERASRVVDGPFEQNRSSQASALISAPGVP
jgi:hypothetical protein